MNRRGFLQAVLAAPFLPRWISRSGEQPAPPPQQRLIDEAGACLQVPKANYVLVRHEEYWNTTDARPRHHFVNHYVGHAEDGWTYEVTVRDGCIDRVMRHR